MLLHLQLSNGECYKVKVSQCRYSSGKAITDKQISLSEQLLSTIVYMIQYTEKRRAPAGIIFSHGTTSLSNNDNSKTKHQVIELRFLYIKVLVCKLKLVDR